VVYSALAVSLLKLHSESKFKCEAAYDRSWPIPSPFSVSSFCDAPKRSIEQLVKLVYLDKWIVLQYVPILTKR
jgi:hypothetical protein